MFFPLESIISFKLGTVIKHATLFPGGFYSSAFGFFMNEDKWNKLSKQDQDAITSVSGEALARLAGKAWDAADNARPRGDEEVGIKIVEASPELVKGVQERAEAVIEDKWIKTATAKGVDGAKVLAEFREELKKRRRRQVSGDRPWHRTAPRPAPGSIACSAPPPPCCCSA